MRHLNLLVGFLMVFGAMVWMVHGGWVPLEKTPATLVLGFLLLASYGIGYFGELLGLPRITGYIIAGLVLGPSFLHMFGRSSIEDLFFLNNLALAYIAFCAGGELRMNTLKKRLKKLVIMLFVGTAIILGGVTLTVFFSSSLFPFMQTLSLFGQITVAAIFGVICVARSPSSTIAVISETKSEGAYTETVLSVTIATDVLVIILFTGVISACRVMLSPDHSPDLMLLVHLSAEIGMTFILGFLVGKALIFLIDKLGVELPVVIAAMGFFVIKFCHVLSDYLFAAHSIMLNLEPLLICMAAGFTVQNFSAHGKTFIDSLDRVSLPIYVAFFAITGAMIDVEILKTGWMLGLIIVISRAAMLYIGSIISGKLAREKPIIYQHAWLGFITQAGVSLGLVTELTRRFPEIGVHLHSILIAAITLNQIIGPVLFKYALNKVGESKSSLSSH